MRLILTGREARARVCNHCAAELNPIEKIPKFANHKMIGLKKGQTLRSFARREALTNRQRANVK